MSSPTLLIERIGPHVGLLTLNRPQKRNALTTELVVEIAGALSRFADEADIRAVVVTGDEKAFSAGADITEMNARGFDAIMDKSRAEAWAAISAFKKPLIAAVNGVAYGGGNELCMLCDIVFAGANARFGQPEVRIGGMAGDGGTQRLVQKVGYAKAMQMLLTGEPITAEEAVRLGYVADMCEPAETVSKAVACAEAIARNAPLSVEATKTCVKAAANMPLDCGLRYERELLHRVFRSSDRQEGMTAFAEKRSPNFTRE